MRRADRLFEIIQLLRQARGPMTAADLAAGLEVNIRTVYRDIAALQGMRVPIEGAAGIGYVMRRGYDLAPLMFDVDEVEAIVVGLGLLARTGDIGLQAAAGRANAKIAEILPEARRDEVEGKHLAVSDWGAAPPDLIDMASVRKALRQNLALRIIYQDETGAETDRVILPVALVYYVQVAVLAAWCRLRGGFRHFRIDRIQSLETLPEDFRREAEDLRRDWEAARAAEKTPN
ncbi:helix-turn-helix transcriptional regulator [Hwanghaeella sp.]|uniref:helix-turn-helix transcriptional regulator n=1 Tax=Hwanghaeella sp. TaxID=2605943 RepID=UPI003CCB7DC4